MSKRNGFIIAANWKMYMTTSEAKAFVHSMEPMAPDGPKLILFVPATALAAISEEAARKNIAVGLQNMHWEKEGAYTGEISADMIRDAGGTQVIVGHSKRRSMFGETDLEVNFKVRTAQQNGLVPCVCIGESIEERESGEYRKVLLRQIVGGLIGVRSAPLVVAYEPVWAIGTGTAATTEQVSETMRWIRRVLIEQFGREEGCAIPLLYGGSAKPENVAELAALDEVNGFLIGRAGLKVDSLKQILDRIP